MVQEAVVRAKEDWINKVAAEVKQLRGMGRSGGAAISGCKALTLVVD